MKSDCCISKPTHLRDAEARWNLSRIFKTYGDQYRASHRVTPKQSKVMHYIEHCRDGELGIRLDVCDTCGHTQVMNCSCRDRHCNTCNGISRKRWVENRLDQLLPIPYYHVVFTLPHVLFPLSLFNAKTIYDLLFTAAAATLKTFAADPKWLGAKIGFYGILHTWGGKLQQHLHLHFIVTGGGLDAAGNWKHLKHKGRFIFPVCALSQRFRYRFLSGLKRAHKKGLLKFPGELKELESYDAFERWIFHTFPKKWVVYAKPPFKGPEQVVKYIGKYTHRVAISNRRILSVENDRVRFMYKNTRHKKARWEETSLPVEAFIRRFLMHILPHRYHRIRHFGILANGQCRENVKDIRQQLTPRVEYPDQDEEPDKMPCPNCKTGRMITQCIISVLGRIIYHRVDDSPAVIPVFEDTS